MKNSCALLAVAIFTAIIACRHPVAAQEAIDVRPRQVETLTIMPRLAPKSDPAPDPAWLIRGALRENGTYEQPLPPSPYQLNERQLELLRGLDGLRTLDSTGKGPDLNRLLGPERILIPPREVRK